MAEKQIIIKNVRCMYSNLKEPYVPKEGGAGKPKFSITVLIPKKDKATVKQIMDYMDEVVKESSHTPGIKKLILSTAKNTDPANNNCFLRDGDKLNEYYEMKGKEKKNAFVGSWILNVKRPVDFGRAMIVTEKNEKILPEFLDAELQSGYWVNVAATPYPYSGVTTSFALTLQAVQRVKVDESLNTPDSPFAALDDVAVEESTGDSPFNDDDIPL